MKKRSKYITPEHYVVVNQDGEVFTGLKGGYFEYSHDWSKAKPLDISSTYYLMRVKGNELIKENEL
jgi:hypothetical protein